MHGLPLNMFIKAILEGISQLEAALWPAGRLVVRHDCLLSIPAEGQCCMVAGFEV